MSQQMPGGGQRLGGKANALAPAGDGGDTQPVTPNPAEDQGLVPALLIIPPQKSKVPRTGGQGEGEGEESAEESDYEEYSYINCKGQSGNYLDLQENSLKPMFLAACQEVAECEVIIEAGPWPPVEEAQDELKAGTIKRTPGAVAAVNVANLFVQGMLELKEDGDRLLAGRVVRGVLDCLYDAPQKKTQAEARRDRIQKVRVSLPKRMAQKRASRIRQECDDAKSAAGCNLVIGKRRKK